MLLLCHTDPGKSPRPRRIIEFSKGLGYHVTVVAPVNSDHDLHIDNFIDISYERPARPVLSKLLNRLSLAFKYFLFLLFNNKSRFLSLYKRLVNYKMLEIALQGNYDIIMVEHIDFLPIVLEKSKNTKVIFDAREYYPKQDNTLRFLFIVKPIRTYICRHYLHLANHVVTVSPGLANEYKRVFNIDTTLLRSTPFYYSMEPGPVEGQKIKIVHHGGASDIRRLERIIDIFKLLDDRFVLHFYLVVNNARSEKYYKKLIQYADRNERIVFKEAVSFPNIIPMLTHYDIGIVFYESDIFNIRHALPNKIFEFIQSRLMVIAGPSPDMAEIISTFNLGLVSKTFDVAEMAGLINALSIEDINKAKANSHKAAQVFCFEMESEKLKAIFQA